MNNNGTAACRECGKPVGPSVRFEKKFCCEPCRHSWTNRRKLRGAELYDLFMAMRYDRGTAKLFGVWAIMCRMASMWKEEDGRLGVKSYASLSDIQQEGRILKYTAVRNTISRRVR